MKWKLVKWKGQEAVTRHTTPDIHGVISEINATINLKGLGLVISVTFPFNVPIWSVWNTEGS